LLSAETLKFEIERRLRKDIMEFLQGNAVNRVGYATCHGFEILG
jgi:hypothetical protein